MQQCPQCHTVQEEAAAFCCHCGHLLSDTQPNQAAFDLPPTNPATLWLTLNIIGCIIFCCGCSLPSLIFHILGIVFSNKASAAYMQGDAAACVRELKPARIFFTIGIVMAASNFLYLILSLCLRVFVELGSWV